MTALRLVDWIWTVRGSLPLGSCQSGDDALARLDGLFHEPGTTRRRDGDALVFRKVNPLSQDRMSVFDHGRLDIVAGSSGATMRYDLSSRALLLCILAPLFFLGVSAIIDGAQISGRVFAGFFVVLYIAGRVLEARLVAALFAGQLAGSDLPPRSELPENCAA